VEARGTHSPLQAPDAQTVAHAPQWFGSDPRLTQAPPQHMPTTSELNAHTTPFSPAAHVGDAQLSLLSRVPVGQLTEVPWQTPATHVSPVGHIAPHAPQLFLSDAKPLAHTPEQQLPTPPLASGQATPEFPTPHVGAGEQTPASQKLPAAHALPQLPQFRLSVLESAHDEPQQRPVPALAPVSAHGFRAELASQVVVRHIVPTHAVPGPHGVVMQF